MKNWKRLYEIIKVNTKLYRWREHLKIATVKSVINSVENEWIMNKWGGTSYILNVQHDTHVFLLWFVGAPASAIACLCHPDPVRVVCWRKRKDFLVSSLLVLDLGKCRARRGMLSAFSMPFSTTRPCTRTIVGIMCSKIIFIAIF